MYTTYFLQHKRESRICVCHSAKQALSAYYSQWRDPDGSIPWTITMRVHHTDTENEDFEIGIECLRAYELEEEV